MVGTLRSAIRARLKLSYSVIVEGVTSDVDLSINRKDAENSTMYYIALVLVFGRFIPPEASLESGVIIS